MKGIMSFLKNAGENYSEITELEYDNKKRVFNFKYSKFRNGKEIGYRTFNLSVEICEELGIVDFRKIPNRYLS